MSAVPLATLTSYLDEYLRIREVPDEANAVNGLQVENSGAVDRIVAAVDASLGTIQALPAGSPLLLVHHGLLWDGNVPLIGRRYQRVRALLQRDAALYSAHIPLDAHPEIGNNAVLARALGLAAPAPFDTYRGVPFGVQGLLDPGEPREAFTARVEQLLGTKARLIPGGPALSRRVGIITGSGGGRIAAAHEAGIDTYLTGEGAHHTYFDAMELGVNLIYAGHYATETVGVKALAAQLAGKFGIPWEFHDHPTGL
ncbi:MAG TPA: Nif3-like dinuclear metal center hexameric protein [Gemmatimonadales bacterium]|jgi:dinuclear metal center YbgI/SA1388 family protein|nr:Nif3-like dinuclear metal center hexameric protein [Gemmatimonadales bacterium]